MKGLAVPSAPTMTKGEREDLQRLIRQREKALKSAAATRSAEMLAEFEQQLASIYSFDQDEVWQQAMEIAHEAVAAANKQIAGRCRKLQIPSQFAPGLALSWHGRGQNAVAARRAELIRVAKSRIKAIEQAAMTQIEMGSVELQTKIAAAGMSSAAAASFLESMPSLDRLMPSLEAPKIEQMLAPRRYD